MASRNSGFTHWKWWFSIGFLYVYQIIKDLCRSQVTEVGIFWGQTLQVQTLGTKVHLGGEAVQLHLESRWAFGNGWLLASLRWFKEHPGAFRRGKRLRFHSDFNILQHTSTSFNILQHTSTLVKKWSNKWYLPEICGLWIGSVPLFFWSTSPFWWSSDDPGSS